MADWFEEYFERASRNPIDWRWKAFELRHAAQCLKDRLLNDLQEREKALALSGQTEVNTLPGRQHGQVPWSPMDPHLLPVWGMLMGMAIEVLAKALIIQKCSEDQQSGKGAWKAHDLPTLVERAGIRLDEKQHRVLQDLAACLIWMGRYPAPWNPQSEKAVRPSEAPTHGGTLYTPGSKWVRMFFSVAEGLYTVLQDQLACSLGERNAEQPKSDQ